MRYTQDEWNKLIAGYSPGTSVSGTVCACERFGVFVLLDALPNVPCLLEVIHFAANESSTCQSIQFPVDYPLVGERINARILAWSEKPHDVRLTQLSHLNWVYSDAAKANH